MSSWPRLRNAPIVEGLIDIRVDRSPTLTFDTLKSACAELAPDFPSQQTMLASTLQFSLSADMGASMSGPTPATVGMVLKSTDEKWIAQFRLDGFTLSRLNPYTSWEELVARAKELWRTYEAVARPLRIVRVAARFINKIAMNLEEPFDKTFATSFSIAEALPQAVAGFILRIVVPFETENCLAIVTQALPENSQDCTFDVDAFAPFPDGASESDAWAKIEQLRSVKNRLFFESLTPQALERFK